jgi:hypothetical protein
MARNDTILIDGILDDRVAERLPSDRRDEAFEYFAFEQVLRDADLSQDEITSGWIDGRDDGGIDGLFVLVNGHPLTDPDSFMWPRSGCELDVWIITCKHHDTFRQAPMDNLVASVGELLDLAVGNAALKGAYSDTLLKVRTSLIHAYRKVSPRLTRFSLHFVYASRGDASNVGDSIRARSEQAVGIARDLFGNCNATFDFVGAAELVTIHRKVRTFSLELPFLEALTRGERYVLLCRLADFHAFVVDEAGKLRRYLFDSNVRAFMGLNRVNEDIKATLQDPASPDFWWLNNGITILANTATVTGKSIQLEGVQIVNGLQTTESIARYFSEGHADPRERSVLVKIVVSRDAAVRDAIIRATNNQTAVELASLHATDKIQRDIEDVLLRDGLFYERRTNFYANQGQPASLIVSPLYIASGYVNFILKSPSSATKLKSRFMRSAESYRHVFPDTAPISVWPVIARILKKTDAFLDSVRPVGTGANERFLKSWRQLTSFLAISRVFGRFTFGARALSDFRLDDLTTTILESSWEFVKDQAGGNLNWKNKIGKSFVIATCRAASSHYSIEGIDIVERSGTSDPKAATPLPSDFVERVHAALPEQPWKPRTHCTVAKQLGCRSDAVYAAIQTLIADGRRHQQKDGIVYGADGAVLAVDESRVPLETAREAVQQTPAGDSLKAAPEE